MAGASEAPCPDLTLIKKADKDFKFGLDLIIVIAEMPEAKIRALATVQGGDLSKFVTILLPAALLACERTK
jgi:hypothetical protein